MNRTKS